MRIWLLKKMTWIKKWLEAWIEAIDICHICGEPADNWCESCEKRHCDEHESHAYYDVQCCVNCAPSREELQAEWDKMTDEERKDILYASGQYDDCEAEAMNKEGL